MATKIVKTRWWMKKKRAASPPETALTLRDEAIAVLRDELGEGFEAATFEALCKEYALRGIKSILQARRVAALATPQEALPLRQAEADYVTSMQEASAKLATARQTAEDALRSAQEARNAAVAQAKAAVETELGTV